MKAMDTATNTTQTADRAATKSPDISAIKPAIDRRDFLLGAAALAVTASLGSQSSAHAEAPASAAYAAAPVLHTTLALATMSGMINPTALNSGALASAVATVKMFGHFIPAGAAAALRVVKAHYAMPVNGRIADVPMYAWTTSVGKGKDTLVKVPIAPGGGLLLSVEIAGTTRTEDSYFLIPGSTTGKPKLIAGTYAIIAGSPDLTGCRLTLTSGKPTLTRVTASGPAPVGFEYLFLTVS
jgi:hypothetical protein